MLKKTHLLFWLIPATLFGQMSLTTAQIAKRVAPAVVVIHGQTDSGGVLGSGFIVSKDGKIVTNLHVIRELRTAAVELANGESFASVSVLATDELRDLAVLQIAGFDLPVLEMGNSDLVKVGEPLVVVGSPRGLEGTVTAGILSSIRDGGEGFKVLQTDAAVNPGNSGGPLVNSRGQVVGVVVSKLRAAENLNFAIPINSVRGLMNALHGPMTLEQMQSSLSKVTSDQGDTGPSLKETLDWLTQKLPLGIVQTNYVSEGAVISTSFQVRAYNLDSCYITIGWEQTTSQAAWGTHQSISGDRYKLALGIITSGEVRDDTFGNAVQKGRLGYEVVLRSSVPEVVMEPYLNDSSPPRPAQAVNQAGLIMFPDKVLAGRVLSAFLHAADLCRNKEPF
jgi:S1-C subfamily serine protease